MVFGTAPAPEAGRMYKWSSHDPHGDDSFLSHQRCPDDEKVPGPEDKDTFIDSELHGKGGCMDKDTFRDLMKRLMEKEEGNTAKGKDADSTWQQTLAELYNRLHANRVVRKLNADAHIMPEEEGKTYLTSRLSKARYWIAPVFLFMCCFAFQSFMLHLGTSLYIRYIEEAKEVMTNNPDNNISHLHFEALEDINMIRNWQLYDVIGDWLGPKVNIPLWLLDLTGFIPVVFFVFSYGVTWIMGDVSVGMWTKTWLLGAIMAVFKGIFDVVTVMPDSGGWHNCKDRLGPHGLKSLENLHFGTQFWESTGRLFIMEFTGAQDAPSHLRGPGKLRYCADMMVSGHTYFAVLFSLSAYKMLRYVTERRAGLVYLRRLAGVVCVLCIIVEVILVALSKFHYTVDMLVSIVLVVLLWDSVRLDTIASDWAEGYHWRDDSFHREWLPCICLQIFWDPLRRRRQTMHSAGSGKVNEVCTSRCRKLLNLGMMVTADGDTQGSSADANGAGQTEADSLMENRRC